MKEELIVKDERKIKSEVKRKEKKSSLSRKRRRKILLQNNVRTFHTKAEIENVM